MIIDGYIITHGNICKLRDKFISHHPHLSLNHEICLTCKHCNMESGKCFAWSKEGSDRTDNYDFVCDFYIRRRSGQYRRKRAKENKNDIPGRKKKKA